MTSKPLINNPTVGVAIVVVLGAVALFVSCSRDSAPRAGSTGDPVAASQTAPAAPVNPDVDVKVVVVADAATIVLANGRRIRQLGIAAPAPGSCEAEHATSEAASEFNHSGHKINIEHEPGAVKDEFGNEWAYIRIETGYPNEVEDYGIDAAKNGYVAPYPASPASPAYEQSVLDAEKYAKAVGLGRFGDVCKPSTPESTATPRGDGDVDVDLPHVNLPHVDDHHKSRFCRKHWFC